MTPGHALLLFPPHVMPWSPYLAPALLKAYAEGDGHHVDVVDLNVPFFEELYSSESLLQLARSLEEMAEDLELRASLDAGDLHRLSILISGIGDATHAAAHINEAVAIYRGPRFHDPDAYAWAAAIVDLALSATSARWYPSELTREGFRSRFSPFSADDAMAFAATTDENPYAGFFKRWLQRVEVDDYDVIAMSVAFSDQVLPAVTLAHLLRGREASFILGGGNFFTRVQEGLHESAALFDAFHAIAVGEGERTFSRLLACVAAGERIDDIPGLVRRHGDVVTQSAPSVPVPARDLPTPDFDGLPLARYFSPEPVLPMLTFKGCSYGKCTFCDHHMNYSVVSARPGEKVAGDVETLARRHGCRAFTFVDEEMPPAHAEGVARALLDRGLGDGIRWMGYAIYGKNWTRTRCELLARAGCRELLFGFESASIRILELMQKPLAFDDVERITTDLNAAGIASRINVIVGFPRETREEAESTLRFFEERPHFFALPGTLIAFHPFLLVRNAPLARDERANDVRIRRGLPLELHYHYDVVDANALTGEEAYALANELASRLSKSFDRHRYPMGRVHRFLYTIRGPAGSKIGAEYNEPAVAATQVRVSNFDLSAINAPVDEVTRECESYEFWMNMQSRTAKIRGRLAGIHAPLAASAARIVYVQIHEPVDGGPRSRLFHWQ